MLDATLDAVWDRLGFAAPWIGEREREEARVALVRFVTWHAEQDRGRTTSAGRRARVLRDLRRGDDEVTLRGSMDRVEVDDDGLVHVVDFKTGKRAPSASEITEHPQLGVYQVAVEQGAADELVGRRARAGAPSSSSSATPTRPSSPTGQGAAAGRPWRAAVLRVRALSDAVRTIRTEQWVATPSPKACRFCAFARVCPAKAEGAYLLDTVAPCSSRRPSRTARRGLVAHRCRC